MCTGNRQKSRSQAFAKLLMAKRYFDHANCCQKDILIVRVTPLASNLETNNDMIVSHIARIIITFTSSVPKAIHVRCFV